MTREEHLKWCKQRAREYLARHDAHNAITSMLSDLSKHEETRGIGEKLGGLGMLTLMNGGIEDARRFIEGFN